MTIVYRILNVMTLVLACVSILSLVYPPLNPWMVALVGPQFATYETMCGSYFAYLIFLAATTLAGLLAVASFPLEFEAPRFPYYCLFLAWAPLIFLTLLGLVLAATGQLFWHTA